VGRLSSGEQCFAVRFRSGKSSDPKATACHTKKNALRRSPTRPSSDAEKIETSISSRWWNKNAKYYLLDNPERLYVVLPWGKVVEFYLDTGRHRYGPSAEFGDLAKAMAKDFANEETKIWETNLRFSSITDVVEAKAKQRAR